MCCLHMAVLHVNASGSVGPVLTDPEDWDLCKPHRDPWRGPTATMVSFTLYIFIYHAGPMEGSSSVPLLAVGQPDIMPAGGLVYKQ
jgi:hypothetical protein